MLHARYYRERAAFCLELVRYMSDPKAAQGLRDSAAQYQAQAEAIEKDVGARPPWLPMQPQLKD